MAKDANGFRTDSPHDWLSALAGFALSIFSVFTYFFLFYEHSFQRTYWVNRWRLYWYLRKDQVKLIGHRQIGMAYFEDGGIEELTLEIGGLRYVCWIWAKRGMTFAPETGSDIYIGLFCASPVMALLKRWTIKRLIALPRVVNLPAGIRV